MILSRGNSRVQHQEEAMPHNPFVAKIEIKKAGKSSNPFAAKVKVAKTSKRSNPFTAKTAAAKKEKHPNPSNPFVSRHQRHKQQQLDQLRALIAEAEHAYEESLDKALRSGVNQQQVKKLFDISDRRMTALIKLNQQLRSKLNGDRP